LEALEGRETPATLTVGPGKMFATIQAAVNAAAASTTVADTILVSPGTYTEQVVIPSSINTTNSLVINAANTQNKPTVQAPATTTGSKAIFDVNGATGVTIENMVINGSGSDVWFGVFVENAGSATIQSNTIQNILASASSGGDTGFAVRVGRSSLSGQPATTGSATVSSNNISNYGKGGIDVANTGSSGTITGNNVTGAGHKVSDNISLIQNGIEMDDGATGQITSNNVSKNGSAKTGFGSAGILLFQPGSGVNVSNNTLTSNDIGIWVFDAASPTVSNNAVSSSTIYGIAFDSAGGAGVTGAMVSNNNSSNNLGEGMDIANTSGSTFANNNTNSNGQSGLVLSTNTTNNTIKQQNSDNNQKWGILVADFDPNNPNFFTYLNSSTASGNTISQSNFTGNNKAGGAFDAEDRSVGSGTAGTADTWSGNTIGTKKPGGLM
jgi:parallel beta-helix repeat protein